MLVRARLASSKENMWAAYYHKHAAIGVATGVGVMGVACVRTVAFPWRGGTLHVQE